MHPLELLAYHARCFLATMNWPHKLYYIKEIVGTCDPNCSINLKVVSLLFLIPKNNIINKINVFLACVKMFKSSHQFLLLLLLLGLGC